jgi:signal transduction histidine kinase
MMREDFEISRGLEDYIATFRERTQLNVQFEREGYPERLPPDAQLTLFRVLQECLSNAARHAAAEQVKVKLAYANGKVHLAVRDDGKGFDPRNTPHGHYGLLNMRERAMKLGGEIVIDSSPGSGAQISLTLPVRA